MIRPPIILASSSPRRRELLEEAGYQFQVMPPHDDAEGGSIPNETPPELVCRLARQKAASVASRVTEGLIVGCDTVAECGGEILGKPRNRQHAQQILRQLKGKVHHVYSGLCLWRRPDDRVLTQVDVTKLKMADISGADLREYLDSGLWAGKAGAFGYQDRHDWLRILAGSESNVVGLPLELLEKMLVAMRGK